MTAYPFGRVTLQEFKAIKAKAAGRKAKRDEKRDSLPWANKVKKPKTKRLSQLEKILWDTFSLYIRIRDKKLYGCRCFYCGQGDIECAGHLISRQRRATKYDESNVFGSCNKCNWKDKFLPGYHDAMVAKYIGIFGADKYQDLVLRSREMCARSSVWIKEKTEFYKSKIERGS